MKCLKTLHWHLLCKKGALTKPQGFSPITILDLQSDDNNNAIMNGIL